METAWRPRKLQIWMLLSAQADEEYLSVASQLPGKPWKLGQMQPSQAWITSPTPDSSIDNNIYTHEADPAPRQHRPRYSVQGLSLVLQMAEYPGTEVIASLGLVDALSAKLS